jgi:uncharacterized membrane protein
LVTIEECSEVDGAERVEQETPARKASRRSKMQTFLLALAVVCFNAFGNLSLAFGMKHLSQSMGLNPVSFLHAMASPFVAAGIALLIFWLLTRMTLMSWADLSFVLPLTGFGYVMAAILGHFFLKEAITPRQWLGTILISAGIAFVGTTKISTNSLARDSA